MDEVVLDGKTYVASKKAATECSYTQDYVGQLARKGLIDARRISGQWYIFLSSLQAYKANAETFKPEPPKYQPDPTVEATIQVEGKEYVSAARAAKLTDYNQDYVGQLARAGKIPSRQVGTRWYVERESLLTHKKEKDALLRAVQAESVGLQRPQLQVRPITERPALKKPDQPLLAYSKDEMPLFPEIHSEIDKETALKAVTREPEAVPSVPQVRGTSKIPIRILRQIDIRIPGDAPKEMAAPIQREEKVPTPGNTIFSKLFTPIAFAAVILIAVGLGVYKRDVIYSSVTGATLPQVASVGGISTGIADFLEPIVTKELLYIRK